VVARPDQLQACLAVPLVRVRQESEKSIISVDKSFIFVRANDKLEETMRLLCSNHSNDQFKFKS
jgi:hypothetical protein